MTAHRKCVRGFWMQACVLLLGGMDEGDRESAMFGMQLGPLRLSLHCSLIVPFLHNPETSELEVQYSQFVCSNV